MSFVYILSIFFFFFAGTTHACTLTRADELTGTFNAHLGFKVLLVSEECTYGGNKKDQGLLKNLITAQTINVRPLYHPLLVLKSRHNLVVISNMNRHVLPIEATERRYACFYPSPKYSGIQTAEAKAYFDKVMSVPLHLIAYFHYFIYEFDDDWNPRASIPVTACTADQKIKSASSATRFLLTLLQTTDRKTWRDRDSHSSIEGLHERYGHWCETQGVVRWDRENLQTFAQTMQKYLKFCRSGGKRALTSILRRQRFHFATAMGLARFPLLGDGEGVQPATKRQRRCPPQCNGRHPAFVRVHSSGELEACDQTIEGAVPYHESAALPAGGAVELAPVFVTADAQV